MAMKNSQLEEIDPKTFSKAKVYLLIRRTKENSITRQRKVVAAAMSYASLLVPKLWHWNFSYTKDSAIEKIVVVEVLLHITIAYFF